MDYRPGQEWGLNPRRKKLEGSSMIEQLYQVQAGKPLRASDGSIIQTPNIIIPRLEIQTGRQSSFGKQFARVRDGAVPSMVNVHLGNDPDINRKLLLDLRAKWMPDAATTIKDAVGIDPDALAMRIHQNTGVKTRSVKTGSLKVISDGSVDLIDTRILNIATHKGPLPPDIKIAYKIITDRDGNKKIAVSQFLRNYTIDFDGDVLFIRELGISVKGVNKTVTSITKFPLYAHQGIWTPVEGQASDSLRFIKGLNSNSILDWAGKDLEINTSNMTEAEKRSAQRMALKEQVMSAQRHGYDEMAMRKAVSRTITPDLIGQVHNRSMAGERMRFFDKAEVLAQQNPEFRQVMDNPMLMDAMWLMRNKSHDRLISVEEVIKAVERGKMANLANNHAYNTNRGFGGVEKLARTYKGMESLHIHQLHAYMQIIGAEGDFVDNMIKISTGQAWSREGIEEIGKIKLSNTTIFNQATQSQSTNIVQQMMRTGDMRVRNVTLNTPVPNDPSGNHTHPYKRNRLTFYEMEDLTSQSYKPIAGYTGTHYDTTKTKMGYAVGSFHVVDEKGNYRFMSGDDLVQELLGRELKNEDPSIYDFRAGKRLPGEVAGRFESSHLLSSEGLADLHHLANGVNQFQGSDLTHSEIREMILADSRNLGKLVRMHDQQMHSGQYRRVEDIMKKLLPELGGEAYYQDYNGRIRLTDGAMATQEKFQNVFFDVAFNDSDKAFSDALHSLPQHVKDMLDLDGVVSREGEYINEAGRVMNNKRNARVLLKHNTGYDSRRRAKIISQQLTANRATQNMVIVDMDMDKLLAHHQKLKPGATMADLEAVMGTAADQGPGEGGFWITNKGQDLFRQSFIDGTSITPGFEGYVPGYGPKAVITKGVGDAWKVEGIPLEMGIDASTESGLPIHSIMDKSNFRGGSRAMVQTFKDAGIPLDLDREDLGLKTEKIRLTGALSHLEVEGVVLKDYTGLAMTATPADQKGGALEEGLGYREVLGTENTDYVLQNIISERMGIAEMEGFDLGEQRALGLSASLQGRAIQGQMIKENQLNKTVSLDATTKAWTQLEEIAGKAFIQTEGNTVITQIAKAQAVQAAGRKGMLDAARIAMNALGKL